MNETARSEIRSLDSLPRFASQMREMGTDFIQVEDRTLRSRWFHGPDHTLDLFIWVDERSQLFKAQANILGQVLEWNIVKGVRSGVSVEEETTTGDDELTVKEKIIFDQKLRPAVQKLAVTLVEHLEAIDPILKADLVRAFRGEHALTLTRIFDSGALSIWKRLRAMLFRRSP